MENRTITQKDVNRFVEQWQAKREWLVAHHAHYDTTLTAYRHIFFRHFLLSDKVPAKLVPAFQTISKNFYDKTSTGYNGIMQEVKDRTNLYSDIDGYVLVREFLKHGEGKSDIYDKEERISYEKKTGCGDWLRSEKSSTFDEIIAEYKRKKTMIRWDYDFIPATVGMEGKKSINKYLSNEQKRVKQESTKIKKDGTPIVNKQYEIHIHIETTYKNLFEYMESYSGGLKTFFKESVRSGNAGVFLWELQTLKNSKKKIEFLQACPYNDTEWKEEED